MKLRYVNPLAKMVDIQVPSVQDEPLEYGGEYTVEDELGAVLLGSYGWIIVPDAPVKARKAAKSNDKPVRKSEE